ncbi:MAG TPA: ester cyclase [Actinomycetes bacterium]|nr:ester cyclase [Actinomycetes bacterium]
MAFDIDGLLSLWFQDPGSDAEAAAAFGAFYTDPVVVNGKPVSLTDLVTRGAALRATFSDLRREILDVCEAGDKVAVAFRMTGHQTGVLATAAGPLPPTGREITVRVIDILTLTDGRISSLSMVADEMGALAAVDAVRLVDTA